MSEWYEWQVYFYGRFDVSGQVGRDAGRQLTDFVSYLSWIGRVAVFSRFSDGLSIIQDHP